MALAEQLVTGVDFVAVPTRDLEPPWRSTAKRSGCGGRRTARSARSPSSRPAT